MVPAAAAAVAAHQGRCFIVFFNDYTCAQSAGACRFLHANGNCSDLDPAADDAFVGALLRLQCYQSLRTLITLALSLWLLLPMVSPLAISFFPFPVGHLCPQLASDAVKCSGTAIARDCVVHEVMEGEWL